MSMAASAMLERARAATPPGENDIVFVDIPPAQIPVLNAFLRQSSSERVSLIQTRRHMREIVQ